MFRLLTLTLAAVLGCAVAGAQPRVEACGAHLAIEHIAAHPAPSPLHGVWRLTSGAVIAIEQADGPTFNIRYYEGADLEAVPGVIVGQLHAGGLTDTYSGTLAKCMHHGKPSKGEHTITATLHPGGANLDFKLYRATATADLWRLIPYLWRLHVRHAEQTPPGVNGAVRIYPPALPTPENPVVL